MPFFIFEAYWEAPTRLPLARDKKKFHLLKWDKVCLPIKKGGLGIRHLETMNKALLGKWPWRVGEENDSLWKSILIAKYGLFKEE